MTFVVLLWINYRVIKIVGKNDLALVLMLVFLKLCMLAYAIFFGFEASINQNFVCFDSYYFCMTGLFTSWPGVFLGQATLLNLNKWIYFIIFVRHSRNVNSDADTFESEIKRERSYLNISTFLCSIALLTSQSFYSVRACTNFSEPE